MSCSYERSIMFKNLSGHIRHSALALGAAVSVAATALVVPHSALANIPPPNSLHNDPFSPPGILKNMQDFRSVKSELQDRLFFGNPRDTENFYMNYPTAQVTRIVNNFLNRMADSYEKLAAKPLDQGANSECVASSGNRGFNPESQQRLLDTATFLRDLRVLPLSPTQQDAAVRTDALAVLSALAPFTAIDVLNQDGTIAQNRLATDPRGVVLTVVRPEYFDDLRKVGTFIGSIVSKGADLPEATVVRATNAPSRSDVVDTLERVDALGQLLTRHITRNHSFPDTMLLEQKQPHGFLSWGLKTQGTVLRPLDCAHPQP